MYSIIISNLQCNLLPDAHTLPCNLLLLIIIIKTIINFICIAAQSDLQQNILHAPRASHEKRHKMNKTKYIYIMNVT